MRFKILCVITRETYRITIQLTVILASVNCHKYYLQLPSSFKVHKYRWFGNVLKLLAV
jgi:hypothetical protein